MSTTILVGIVGSRAYGLDHEDSDTDRMGVFAHDTIDLLGLDAPEMVQREQVPGSDDLVLHELAKFLKLVLRCNPTATELLWLPDELIEVQTEAGRRLRSMKNLFLTAEAVRSSYLRYAHDQARRIARPFETPGRREKAARHTWRLVHQGCQLWTSGVLRVRLSADQAEECLDFGSRVGAGDTSAIDRLLAEADRRFDSAPSLTMDPDRARQVTDSWLKDYRAGQLRHLWG